MLETRFNPWVRKIPWRRKWQPTPVLLPGKFYGWRNLIGYSPWDHRESDTTEWLCFHFQSSCCWNRHIFLNVSIIISSSPVFSKLVDQSNLTKLKGCFRVSVQFQVFCNLQDVYFQWSYFDSSHLKWAFTSIWELWKLRNNKKAITLYKHNLIR